MSVSVASATRNSNQPLGVGRDVQRRLLLHHAPIVLASALVLLLFVTLPLFNASAYPHADIVSSTFPQQQGENHAGSAGHGGNHTAPMQHGGHHAGSMRHGGDDNSSNAATTVITIALQSRLSPSPGDMHGHGRTFQQFTVATGYIALGLLGLTLLVGPANLLLRGRVPVSNYLRRDLGTWVAIFSVLHVIIALLAPGSGLIASFLFFFVAPDGSLLTNSFGLGNWTGLAALVIVVALLMISSDFALRSLKATLWKRLQRLNYALLALVVLHAFFYGAFLRMTSPFTLLLCLSVTVVFLSQGLGIWLWRRRYSRIAGTG
jgi:sulfoxide reductase heme-binding subunit YedZ